MVRIISGGNRGKKILASLNISVRPTTNMAKESLFNILNNQFYFDEIKVLDLFAGTGNISYELASRGCKDITAVDIEGACINFIEKTAVQLGFKNITAYRADVMCFLEKDYHRYDLIFADPPYDYKDYGKLVSKIFFKRLLKENGVLVIEHSSQLDLSGLNHFGFSRKYSNMRFSFLQKTPS